MSLRLAASAALCVSICLPAFAQVMRVDTPASSFADTSPGNTSLPLFFRITNTGTANVTLSSIIVQDPATQTKHFYFVQNGCPVLLTPKLDCTFAVVFQPLDQTTSSTTLKIYSNTTPNPFTFALTGTGNPNPGAVITPPSAPVVFKDTKVHKTRSLTFTLVNNGSIPVDLSGLQLNDMTNFTLTPVTCNFGPGYPCTITVQFNPQTTGSFNTSLALPISSPVTFSMSLTGTGN